MMIASLEKEKKSSEHNMFQNIMYMIRIAWAERKSVLVLCLMLTILPVIENLLNIFIIPSILTAIEENKTLLQLVYTIVIFVGLLMLVGTIYTYFAVKEPFEHAAFRIIMTSKINHKIVHMSYPHMENQDVIKKIERVNKSIIDDNSSTQAIWVSLTNLMKNCLGFAVYLALLSSLETWILGIVLVTAILSFLANRFINRWSHQIKEEEAEYSHKMEYISERASDAVIAKDIRLFGMRNWLETIYNETLQLYHSLVERREKKYILGDCANIALTLIRNGVAYIYLIALVMDGAISAPEFLLYFTSVGSFAGWVDGVFSGFIDMHKYSLEISTLRDFLEYPELFKFEDGESLEMNLSEDYQIQLKNISFRYSPNGKDILKNICLTIKPGEKLAIVGLNGAGKTIGAYQGYHGEAWFQKGSNTIEENVSNDQPSGKQETNVFTLRDSDGNILMTGGIKSAEATMVDNGDGIKKAVVQIEFDDESTKTFADITTNNIGNTIGIYLNDEMIANPRVMCAITEGSCQIEVDTYEQAQVLSEALEKCK